MKELTLTDDEYTALEGILTWFKTNYPKAGRLSTYAHIISYHMEKEVKGNEGNKACKKEP